MFTKALIAFLFLPGVFSGLVPIGVGVSDPWRGSGNSLGFVIIAIGFVALASCIRDFYISGKGTLAPWAPPEDLVIVGLYRYMRNPMYLSVLFIVCGFALAFTSPLVTVYCLLLALSFHLRVIFNEEIWLAKQFDEEWINYVKGVSRWVPKTNRYGKTNETDNAGTST